MNNDVGDDVISAARVEHIGSEGNTAAGGNENEVPWGQNPVADDHEVRRDAAHDLRSP
jgi:hypothetical protein